jgi:hypothetical protein
MLKNTLRIFHDYFHNFKTFNTKFIKKYNSARKIYMKKIIIYFYSIEHHIISYNAKFKVQIQLVSGEIKKRNLIRG